MAPPVAIAAATPQIEIPEASGEPLAGHVIDHRPIDQIGLDDRGDAAQQDRGREVEAAGRGDGNGGAEDDDGDLDVEFRADRLLQPFREARKEIRDHQAGQQRDDEAALVGELQRPRDAEFLLLGRRHRREMGVAADDPARIGDGKDHGEGGREFSDIAAERRHGRAEHDEKRGVGRQQRAATPEPAIALGDRRERLGQIRVDRGGDGPSQQIDAADTAEREHEHANADDDGQPILGDRRGLEHDRLRRVDGEIRHSAILARPARNGPCCPMTGANRRRPVARLWRRIGNHCKQTVFLNSPGS
jgi:hypothetical protein